MDWKNFLGWWLICEVLVVIMTCMVALHISNIKGLIISILFTTILFTMVFVGIILI